MIKIALADDHALFRKGVAGFISNFKDMTLLMQAGNGKELVDLMHKGPELPDVCVLDIKMPLMDGYETAKTIRATWPDIKILALSMYDTELNVIKMLRNGANGYVLKDTEPEELENAIKQIHGGDFYHSEVVTGRVLKYLEKDNRETEKMHEKEMQFLKLCCTEMTYREIANEMHLSPRTVDTYRENLFAKLDVKTRTGLVIHAIKAGMVQVNQ